VFSEPDRFDLGRVPSGHLTFGSGTHHCLGAPLARVELQEALRGLVTRLPGLALAVPPADLRFKQGMAIYNLQGLPITWTAAELHKHEVHRSEIDPLRLRPAIGKAPGSLRQGAVKIHDVHVDVRGHRVIHRDGTEVDDLLAQIDPRRPAVSRAPVPLGEPARPPLKPEHRVGQRLAGPPRSPGSRLPPRLAPVPP
jgi:hypothetical protein